MSLDPQIAGLIDALDAGFPPVHTMTGAEARAVIRSRLAPSAEPEEVGEVRDASVRGPGGDIAVRIYRPVSVPGPAPTLVYAHGGGFVFCDLDSHDGLCRSFTNLIPAVVVSVAYRLAPEDQWPAAAEDVLAVAQWAARNADALEALKLTGHGLYDAARAAMRLSPHYVATSGEPGSAAVMTAPEARGYRRLIPAGQDFDERVAARFALKVGLYSPGRKLRNVSVPVLVQVATNDQTTPPGAAVKAAKRAGRGVVKTYDIGHFEPYVAPAFDSVIGDQIEFLEQALDPDTKFGASPTAVITGAGAGIGRAAARRFAARGWTLCATDVNSSALETLRDELGDRHTYATMNVTDKDEVSHVLAEFAAKHGGTFDLLLNNAGVAFLGDFEALTLDQHELVTSVNVNGVLNCTYLAFPYLSKAQDARVINMCSAAAEYGLPSEATYSASKFWVRGFTEAMNIEWEQHGIHVCDIMPNFVATPMMDVAPTDIVNSVGIKLAADDVADTILKAAGDRSRVHWAVDTTKGTILRAVSNHSPASIRRSLIKRLAGY